MLLLGGILVLGMGLLMLLTPHTWWTITESWKSSAGEPSDFYLKVTRWSGAFVSLVGLAGVVVFFLPLS